MQFTNIDSEGYKALYNTYKDESYAVFYRHMEDFLNYDEFVRSVSGYRWLMAEDAFVMLDVKPKPKLCLISVLVFKESQGEGVVVEVMKDLLFYLFNNGIERVVVNVLEDDKKLNAICLKGGFEREGVSINSCKIIDLHNEVRYGMSKEMFFEKYGGKNG